MTLVYSRYICIFGKTSSMRLLLIPILLLSFHCSAHQKSDTVKIYFDLAVPTLNSAAMRQLDSLAYHNILPPNKRYGIIGYADYLGSDSSNITLSQNRANNVQQYLLGLGVKQDSIAIVTGKGEVARDIAGDDGYPEDRRVDIILGGFKKPAPVAKPVTKVVPAPTSVNRIDISKVQKNQTINLDNIFFHPGSHKIKDESVTALFNLYLTMTDNPTLKINIEGHICCLTNTTHDGYDYDAQEYRLSENRAKAVYDYLLKKGIDKSRMDYEGFGISKPLRWPERSLADENMNRRVEIRIIEK